MTRTKTTQEVKCCAKSSLLFSHDDSTRTRWLQERARSSWIATDVMPGGGGEVCLCLHLYAVVVLTWWCYWWLSLGDGCENAVVLLTWWCYWWLSLGDRCENPVVVLLVIVSGWWLWERGDVVGDWIWVMDVRTRWCRWWLDLGDGCENEVCCWLLVLGDGCENAVVLLVTESGWWLWERGGGVGDWMRERGGVVCDLSDECENAVVVFTWCCCWWGSEWSLWERGGGVLHFNCR